MKYKNIEIVYPKEDPSAVLNEEYSPAVNNGVSSGYYYQGKEVILGRRRGRPRKHKRYREDWFPQQTKVDACTLYCVYGDFEQVQQLTNVPVNILKAWHQEPWWVEIQKQVYIEQNENLASRINQVLDKSIEEISDRLEHGDIVLNQKTGTLVRRAVDTKTLATLFNNLTTKRQLVRGEPTSISAKIGVEERLKSLSDAFEKFAKSKLIEDGVIIDDSQE